MSKDEFIAKWYTIAPFSKMEIEYYADRNGYVVRVVWFARGELLTFIRVMMDEDMENPLVANSYLKEIAHRFFESLVEEPEKEQKHE